MSIPDISTACATEQMAEEVKFFNEKLKATDTPYILIGPGRWGTTGQIDRHSCIVVGYF